MSWRKKVEAGISIFLVITLILSISPLVNSEEVSNPIDDPEIREFSVFNIDIKVRNEDSGIIEWADSVNAYVGDIISFNIKIDNICNYDLVNLQVVDIIDSPEILSYIADSAIINNVYFEPDIQIELDETLLTWDINKFLANGNINIIFNMIANQETEIDGVTSSVIVSSKLDNRYYEHLAVQKNILIDKESELLQISADISDQQFIHDGFVVDLDNLILQESELSSEILAISDTISFRESEAVIIESQMDILNSEIDTLNFDRTGEELELSDLQLLISEKQTALQVKNDLVVQLQADLDLELEILSLLHDEFDLAILNADISDLAIQNLENIISVEDELKNQMIQTIVDVEGEIAVLNNELSILMASEAQIEDNIAANLGQQNQLSLIDVALQAQYQDIINEIDMLISEKDLKIQNQYDIQVEIVYNEAVELELIEDIESLVIVETLLIADIASFENDLVVQYDLLDLYESELAIVEGEISSITTDLSNNVAEHLLVIDEIDNYEVLKQNKIDSIAFMQLELDGYNIELNLLYDDLNDAYGALNLNDGLVSTILAEIDRLEALSDLQVNIISTMEDDLDAIILRIGILQNNELLLAVVISDLEADLSDNIYSTNMLNIQINNLQLEIDGLNEDILAGNVLLQDLQAAIFAEQQVLYGVEGEINVLLDEESDLVDNIALHTDSIEFNSLERISLESDYQTVLTDIGSLGSSLNYKIEALQLLQDQLSVAQIQHQEKTDDINLQTLVIFQLQGELVILNDELDTVYSELEGNNGVVVDIQNQIDAKLEQITLQNQIIDAAVIQAATVQGEIDELIVLADQIQVVIDLTDQQIASNDQEILSVSSDLGNIVDSISSKDLEVVSLDDEILIAQDDLAGVNQNLDLKVQEFDDVEGEISIEENLLQTEVTRSIQLDNTKTSLDGELVVLQDERTVLLKEPVENSLEIDGKDLEIQGKELEISQVTRDIGDCEFIKEIIVVNIDGLLVEKSQIESEIVSLSAIVIQKEQVIAALVLDQSDLIDEIELLNIDRTNAESYIQSKIDENSALLVYKNIKIVERDDVIDQREGKEILYQGIVDDIAIYNSLLAQYEGELAQLYDDRNAAMQETQGTSDVITGLINSIESMEDQIAQKIILRDTAVAEQSLINNLINQLDLDIVSVNAEIDVLNAQIAGKQSDKSGLESEISDSIALSDLLSAEKLAMETDLLDVQSLIVEKQEAASILRVAIEGLEYQRDVVSADLVSYEGLKSQKNSDKLLLVAEYDGLLIVIDGLFVAKDLKVDEQNVLLAEIASEEGLKQAKIDDIALENSKYDSYQAELVQQYSALDIAVLDAQGSNVVITELQGSIAAKEGSIAEKSQEKALAETELNGIIEDLDVYYTQGANLAYVISDLEQQEIDKNLESESLTLSIASVNSQIILLEGNRDIKAQALVDTQNDLNVKQSDLLGVQTYLDGLYTQDSALGVDIASLETNIVNKQLLVDELEEDIAGNQYLLTILESECENSIAEQDSIKMQIINKQSFLDMKTSNLLEYNDLLDLQEQNLIDLNVELDQARLLAAGENDNINSLLDQIAIQGQIVDQESQGIQIEIDFVNSLGYEIGSYLSSEQILIQSIDLLNEQLLLKQGDLDILDLSHQGILSDIQSLVLQKGASELELVNVGIDKTNKIQLIDAKIVYIEGLVQGWTLLDDDIRSLRDDIYVLEDDISLIEDHSSQDTSSVVVYVTIDPNDLSHEVDVKNNVWNEDEARWDIETDVMVNEAVRFRIIVSNNDDMLFETVIVENHLPLGLLEYEPGNINSDEPDSINGNILTWSIEKLGVGESVTIIFEATAVAEGVDYNFVTVFIDSVFVSKDQVRVGVSDIPNQPPVAVDDSASTVVNNSVDIDVLDNDLDPDGAIIDPATVEIVDDPLNGSVAVDEITGIISYSPNPDFIGTNSFSYTVKDTDSAISNIATVSVEVKEEEEPTYTILSKPEAGKMFFFDGEPSSIGSLAKFFDYDSIVIGKITVEVDVDVAGFNTERVEFFLDDELLGNSTLASFSLTIDQFLFGVYNLKVVAYDGDETINQECKVLFINLGLFSNR